MQNNSAPVFDIARCSLHDGPGVRTVVYLKGCPLRCAWCHNPEEQSPEPQLLYHAAKCIGCGRCAAACPLGLHRADAAGAHIFARRACIACGRCAESCPTGALSLCGKTLTASEVMAEVEKDAAYYAGTGGGVTLSGGEALLYPDFDAELFSLCIGKGINTTVETSLCVERGNLDKILPLTDLLIADFKHCDGAAHRRLTGAGNELIKSNLIYAAQRHGNIWIRIPLIPGQNEGDENLIRSAEFIKSLGGAVKRVELLKFNNLYESKYRALGAELRYPCSTEPQDDMELARKYAIINGV